MRDLDYLKLLSREFPTAKRAGAEIINLRAICGLPKGTEYFFSDLHGEYESFIHLLRSSSGIVRAKIEETFGNLIPEEDQIALANLIYYPEKVLTQVRHEGRNTPEWQKITINRLIRICKDVSTKYTRSKVRKKLPVEYAYAIDELINVDYNDADKKIYHQEILNTITDINAGNDFIISLCELIQNLTIDSLHIIGDIFDRGPRADIIMEELMRFHDVDIQWGNHDIDWMGAATGNTACIANVLRIATAYNSFDVLEDGYGINLRPLSMFAAEVYKDDPCERFHPHLLDENLYDSVDPELAAKMCKAITIIQFKLEGALIQKHPEYGMDDRLLFNKVNFAEGTIELKGKTYKLLDRNFPTVNPENPLKLTTQEADLMNTLRLSFKHSQLLHKHIRFIYSHGGIYKICNGNLLYHGCIPFNEDGSFMEFQHPSGSYRGKELMDFLNQKIIDAYFLDEREHPVEKADARDLMWYLWCGSKSPVFGKDKMTTFEHCFIDDPALHEERYNAYYRYSKEEAYVDQILKNFGLATEGAHIINGHVPVKTKKGEKPVKANGKLFIIDGGLSKAYHAKTGIAGYTLIYNSKHLALAAHKPFRVNEENTPQIQIVEQMKQRVMVQDTDTGKELQKQIEDLKELLEAYNKGLIKERSR